MRIAITGSSGLIGSATLRALQARGDEVIRIVRPGSRSQGITWDPGAGRVDTSALEGIDAMVHLAGQSIAGIWTSRYRRKILESRVRGTSLIATAVAALRQPPRVLVSA